MKALLALEDGTVFEGMVFGSAGERYGEVVFNTSMTGYQEIITDPSYKGQIVVMTYPLIGNYGVTRQDVESGRPFVEGFIVKELSRIASNWRSQKSLDEYLKENKIMGIEGIDTRALTRHIRLQGAMKAVISTGEPDKKRLVKKAKDSPGLIGRDLVKEVSCRQTFVWPQSPAIPLRAQASHTLTGTGRLSGKQFKIVVLDCGVKYNILRSLVDLGCQVIVVPAKTGSEEILKIKPNGILLSNGPGDPTGVPYVVETVKKLIYRLSTIDYRLSIMGICLGHQILGLALGGKTYKLKFGHHGGNHPVKDLTSAKVYITAQNHGFCVDIESLSKKDVEITHINLNDNTLEGMRHKNLPLFSVQFHPESSPGPHEARYLFEEFIGMMKKPVTRNQ